MIIYTEMLLRNRLVAESSSQSHFLIRNYMLGVFRTIRREVPSRITVKKRSVVDITVPQSRSIKGIGVTLPLPCDRRLRFEDDRHDP